MSSIFLSQALMFAAQQPRVAKQPRPEAHLEEALHAFWTTWAEGLNKGAARRQATMKSPSWPGVGKVDLELVSSESERLVRYWLEVKWKDLWNCPWDVAKLALALREGLCDRAMLIAAAPDPEWMRPGGEFFRLGNWNVAHDVIDAHHRSWLYWKSAVKSRPLRLPAMVETIWVSERHALPDPFRGWALIAAEIGVPKDGWISVDEDRRAQLEP